MKFQNPSLNSVLNGRTEGRTDGRTNERTSRKQYAPHFFKVGGIKTPLPFVSVQSEAQCSQVCPALFPPESWLRTA